MKQLLNIEQVAQLALAILGLYLQPITIAWWLWPIVFLAPDFGMLGYLVNSRIGAWLYNLVHHKATAALFIFIGYFSALPVVLFIGLILYAHSAFDRMLGYGLKYENGFKHTHLGNLEQKQKSQQPIGA